MTIETKYNIGDEVWFSSLGFAKSAKICHIIINVFIDGDTSFEYGLENRGYYWIRNEHEISPTKEELLKSVYYDTKRISRQGDEYLHGLMR